MPLYDFACRCGMHFEQRVATPETPAVCPRCKGLNASTRLPSKPMAVIYRGQGFYATDYPSRQ